MSIYMFKVIQEEEEIGTINNNSCDKELILEGLEMDISKIDPIVQEDIVQNMPLMMVKMEIMSIEDFKFLEQSQNNSKGEID